MKAIAMLLFVSILCGIVYLGYSAPQKQVKCDSKGAIAIAVYNAKGC